MFVVAYRCRSCLVLSVGCDLLLGSTLRVVLCLGCTARQLWFCAVSSDEVCTSLNMVFVTCNPSKSDAPVGLCMNTAHKELPAQ